MIRWFFVLGLLGLTACSMPATVTDRDGGIGGTGTPAQIEPL